MPPQRRKIVPPNTTNKARKKVAGSNRAPQEQRDDVENAVIDGVDTTVDAPAADPSAKTVSLDKGEHTGPGQAEATSVDNDSDTAKTGAAQRETATTSSAVNAGERTNWTPVWVVGAAAAVFAVFAIVAAWGPGADIDNKAWVDQAATSEVTRAATDAAVALYSYKDTTIDEDFDRARTYLNPQMLAEFDEAAETTKSAVVQTQTSTEADLVDVGVARLEDGRAELVANLNVSATQAGVAQGNALGPITMNMEKVDGKWLLSAISDS